jgi:hypothetical protein
MRTQGERALLHEDRRPWVYLVQGRSGKDREFDRVANWFKEVRLGALLPGTFKALKKTTSDALKKSGTLAPKDFSHDWLHEYFLGEAARNQADMNYAKEHTPIFDEAVTWLGHWTGLWDV